MRASQALVDVVNQLPSIAKAQGGAVALVDMLAEDHVSFEGLSVGEADWLRAHIYAAIALTDHADRALVAAREDLRTSSSPHVLAGLARVLRAAPADRAWRSSLVAALRRIEFADVYPDFLFDPPTSPCCGQRSCVREIETTLANLSGQDVPAFGAQGDEAPEFGGRLEPGPLSMALQDQAGEYVTLDGLLRCAPVVLALFYTRCMNPLKCSQTISRLAACARAEPELVYVGMSYDPQYDTPRRLKLYGDDRSFPFSASARIVRCPDGWDGMQEQLSLRAGYGASTVNAHAREVFLLTEVRDCWRLPPEWLREPSKILEFASERSKAHGPVS